MSPFNRGKLQPPDLQLFGADLVDVSFLLLFCLMDGALKESDPSPPMFFRYFFFITVDEPRPWKKTSPTKLTAGIPGKGG